MIPPEQEGAVKSSHWYSIPARTNFFNGLLGEVELFDFLTLFDYAKADAGAFDDLVAALRETEEWRFVEREVDIRLVRVG